MIEQIYLFPRFCSNNSTVIPCNVAELAFLPRLSELLLSTDLFFCAILTG